MIPKPSLPADVRARLDAEFGSDEGAYEVRTAESTPLGVTYRIVGQRRVAVGEGPLATIDVRIAVPAILTADHGLQLTLEEPDADAVADARAHARDLLAGGAVEGWAGAAPPAHRRPTHTLLQGPEGRRILRRLGFRTI